MFSIPSYKHTSPMRYITPCLEVMLIFILATPANTQQTIQTTIMVTATPTSPHPPSYTSPEVFRDTVLSSSNTYRKEHNASDLVWNETLTLYAKDWAEGCKWKHSHGPYGENLAFGYQDASAAVFAWGDERRLYDFKKPTGFSEETGHFTQLVWRATTDVGCAAIDCGYGNGTDDNEKSGDTGSSYTRAQGWYVVCEYSPPGNVMGTSRTAGGENGLFKVNVQSASTYSGPYPTDSGSPPASTSGVSGADRMFVPCGWIWGWIGALVLMVMG
ncbi:CAP domain-containing protein [Aspergillus pseudonomiae]|uniref:CAP domain-containing protein n=1 Tax=Aspergillus pseudonomiae TaxID=1506151 RepID=A0A5N7DHL9_9EURO|nr:CAP domain-containing protein [Aspergillus pseudonomiae]KAB8265677.1 CAP domain-containing protein [Aspergillus pseudonomiae]KAE8405725.1 CAP domain-containing protein [Aspergillus pseudonomiae]